MKPEEYRAQLVQGQPPVLLFSYSQSPQSIVPIGANGRVTADDPKRIPGWVDIRLDPQGRLTFFQTVPQREAPASASAIDWNRLFEAAGLDASRWTPAEPREIPVTAFDERNAWTGTYPNSPQMPLRIEAAAWQGRPVYFEMFGPWRPEPTTAAVDIAPTPIAIGVITVIVPVGALLFALRNLRTGAGRSQRRGAPGALHPGLPRRLVCVASASHRDHCGGNQASLRICNGTDLRCLGMGALHGR